MTSCMEISCPNKGKIPGVLYFRSVTQADIEVKQAVREACQNKLADGAKNNIEQASEMEKKQHGTGTASNQKTQISKTTTDQNNDAGSLKCIKSFYCHRCGVLFEDFEKLHDHIFKSSDKKHMFRCPSCNYIVGKTMTDIVRHTDRFCSREDFEKCEEEVVQKQPDEKHYFCETCGKGINLLTELYNHKMEHTMENLCCSLCDKQTTTFSELLFHFRDHTVVGNVYLPCKFCSLIFYAALPMKLHYFTVHSHFFNIPFECDLCPRVFFDDDENFVNHVQSHSIINRSIKAGRPKMDVSYLTCEVCAEVCESSDACKDHKRNIHKLNLNDKRLCPQCGANCHISEVTSHLLLHRQEKAAYLLTNNIQADLSSSIKQQKLSIPLEKKTVLKPTHLLGESQSPKASAFSSEAYTSQNINSKKVTKQKSKRNADLSISINQQKLLSIFALEKKPVLKPTDLLGQSQSPKASAFSSKAYAPQNINSEKVIKRKSERKTKPKNGLVANEYWTAQGWKKGTNSIDADRRTDHYIMPAQNNLSKVQGFHKPQIGSDISPIHSAGVDNSIQRRALNSKYPQQGYSKVRLDYNCEQINSYEKNVQNLVPLNRPFCDTHTEYARQEHALYLEPAEEGYLMRRQNSNSDLHPLDKDERSVLQTDDLRQIDTLALNFAEKEYLKPRSNYDIDHPAVEQPYWRERMSPNEENTQSLLILNTSYERQIDDIRRRNLSHSETFEKGYGKLRPNADFDHSLSESVNYEDHQNLYERNTQNVLLFDRSFQGIQRNDSRQIPNLDSAFAEREYTLTRSNYDFDHPLINRRYYEEQMSSNERNEQSLLHFDTPSYTDNIDNIVRRNTLRSDTAEQEYRQPRSNESNDDFDYPLEERTYYEDHRNLDEINTRNLFRSDFMDRRIYTSQSDYAIDPSDITLGRARRQNKSEQAYRQPRLTDSFDQPLEERAYDEDHRNLDEINSRNLFRSDFNDRRISASKSDYASEPSDITLRRARRGTEFADRNCQQPTRDFSFLDLVPLDSFSRKDDNVLLDRWPTLRRSSRSRSPELNIQIPRTFGRKKFGRSRSPQFMSRY